MIDYIHAQLIAWSDWSRTGHARLGFPRQSAFMAVTGGGGPAPAVPDDHAMAVEHAIRALPPDQREVVDLYYLRMRTCGAETIARQLGCHRDTLYARLHRAHVGIMESMQDQAVQHHDAYRALLDNMAWRATA